MLDLGPLIVDIAGVELTVEDREFLQHPNIGGVILFARNFICREQVGALVAEIKALRQPSLLIYVDQEGGRVQRFKEGFKRLPPLAVLGKVYDSSPSKALEFAESTAWLMASEILSCGIDVSFAPVLDIDTGISEVIGNRSFHHEPKIVSILGLAYCQGLKRAGMASTGKHFPGHGSVAADSHLCLPEDPRPLKTIEEYDLIPFKELIKQQALSALMSAHVVFNTVDANPASFSSVWLEQILARQLGFKGLIYSDDLGMAGALAVGDVATCAQRALSLGCDQVLICNDRAAAIKAVETVKVKDYAFFTRRLESMRGMPAYIDKESLESSPAWQKAAALLTALNEKNY